MLGKAKLIQKNVVRATRMEELVELLNKNNQWSNVFLILTHILINNLTSDKLSTWWFSLLLPNSHLL